MCLKILALAFWLGTSFSGIAAGSLLVNGDFSRPGDSDDPVPAWTANEHLALQQYGIIDGAGREGSPALMIRPMLATGRNSVLSQRVPVEPGQSYLLLAWARMDDPVIGPGFRIGRQSFNILQHWARSTDWQLVAIPYQNDNRREVEVEIFMPNRGERRFTIGAPLYVDSVRLLRLENDGPVRLAGGDNAELKGTADIAAGIYYVWARVRQTGLTRYQLRLGNEERSFRGYTTGRDYWLRPILPELVLPASSLDINLTASRPDTAITELVLTPDQFWQPDDADTFLAVDEVQQLQTAQIQKPVTGSTLDLSVVGNTPGDDTWPVTQGLPFPRGTLYPDSHVRRADAQPLQTETLTSWPDGSVQWMMLNTMARGGETITLEYGTAITPPEITSSLVVRHDDNAVHVDTGPLRFNVPLDGSALLSDLETPNSRISRIDSIVAGRFFAAHAGVEVKIEEDGPVRAAILITGDYLDDTGAQRLSFQLRVYAYAGRSMLELEPVFLLAEDVVSYDLEQVTWRFERVSDQATLYPGDQPVHRSLAGPSGDVDWYAGIRSQVADRNDFPYIITQEPDWRVEGREAQGRMIVTGTDGPLALHIEDFWQNAPKRIVVGRRHIDLGLLAGPFTFYNGMAKTHRLLLDMNGETDWLDLGVNRPLLLAKPVWYSDSMALMGHFLTQCRDRYPLIENFMDSVFDVEISRQNTDMRTPDFGGMIHFGDRIYNPGPPIAGNNLETALGQCALIQLLRTQDRERYLPFLDRAIRHFGDIDIDHSRSSAGGIFIHSPHERAGLDPGGRTQTHGHSWFDGTYHYGLLMGRRRMLDMAPAVGAHYAALPHSFDNLLNYWRSLAWKTKAVLCAYGLTHEPAWLEACRRDMRITAHQRDFLAGPPGAYQLSLGLAALRRYYSFTSDPAVRELYMQLVDTLLPEYLRRDGALPDDQDLIRGISGRGLAVLNELAWAWRWTGDDLYVRYGAARLNRMLSFGATPDPAIVWGAADFIAAMAELGLPETDVALPEAGRWIKPPLDGTPTERPVVIFQAERKNTGPLEAILFQTERLMRAADFEVEIFDPEGERVLVKRRTVDGQGLYRLSLPAGGRPGRYTIAVHLENYYRWTTTPLLLDLTGDMAGLRAETARIKGSLQHQVINAEPGIVTLTLRPRSGNGRARLDELLITPFDYVPYNDEPLPDAARKIGLANLDIPPDWRKLPDRESVHGHVLGYPGPGLHLGGDPEPLRVTIELEPGLYRVFLRCWHSVVENIEIANADNPESIQPLSLRVFTMDGFRLDPRWGLVFVPADDVDMVPSGEMELHPAVRHAIFAP